MNRDIVINRVLYGTAAFGKSKAICLSLSVCLSVCLNCLVLGHLKPGDIVVELNGTLVKGRSLDDVVYMLVRQCICASVIACIKSILYFVRNG